MVKPMEPTEETQITRKQIGYNWSYSYEHGPSGNRQKLILTGNVEGMARAMTELKKAKISLMELAEATPEELARLPPYEGYSKKDREDAGENLLY